MSLMLRTIFFFGIFCLEAGAAPLFTSLIEVLSVPEKLNSKTVTLGGFLVLEHEGNALYFHNEDYKHGLYANSLWCAGCDLIKHKEFNKRYVYIEGVIDSKNYGHMGLWPASIKEIKRIWEPSKPRP